MFSDKINEEYDLEQLVKHFFLYWSILQKNIETYCVRCKKKPENLNLKIFKTKNGRMIIQSKCVESGFKKSRFVNEQEAKILLSNLTIKFQKNPIIKRFALNTVFLGV